MVKYVVVKPVKSSLFKSILAQAAQKALKERPKQNTKEAEASASKAPSPPPIVRKRRANDPLFRENVHPELSYAKLDSQKLPDVRDGDFVKTQRRRALLSTYTERVPVGKGARGTKNVTKTMEVSELFSVSNNAGAAGTTPKPKPGQTPGLGDSSENVASHPGLSQIGEKRKRGDEEADGRPAKKRQLVIEDAPAAATSSSQSGNKRKRSDEADGEPAQKRQNTSEAARSPAVNDGLDDLFEDSDDGASRPKATMRKPKAAQVAVPAVPAVPVLRAAPAAPAPAAPAPAAAARPAAPVPAPAAKKAKSTRKPAAGQAKKSSPLKVKGNARVEKRVKPVSAYRAKKDQAEREAILALRAELKEKAPGVWAEEMAEWHRTKKGRKPHFASVENGLLREAKMLWHLMSHYQRSLFPGGFLESRRGSENKRKPSRVSSSSLEEESDEEDVVDPRRRKVVSKQQG